MFVRLHKRHLYVPFTYYCALKDNQQAAHCLINLLCATAATHVRFVPFGGFRAGA